MGRNRYYGPEEAKKLFLRLYAAHDLDLLAYRDTRGFISKALYVSLKAFAAGEFFIITSPEKCKELPRKTVQPFAIYLRYDDDQEVLKMLETIPSGTRNSFFRNLLRLYLWAPIAPDRIDADTAHSFNIHIKKMLEGKIPYVSIEEKMAEFRKERLERRRKKRKEKKQAEEQNAKQTGLTEEIPQPEPELAQPDITMGLEPEESKKEKESIFLTAPAPDEQKMESKEIKIKRTEPMIPNPEPEEESTKQKIEEQEEQSGNEFSNGITEDMLTAAFDALI